MPRSTWRGAISFGMVAIPVRLYRATEQKATVSFHLLCPRDGSRIKNLRWCPKEKREIPWSEVVHGYEVAKDEYVEFSDEDFDRLPLPSAHTIEIAEFVEAGEIPSLYVDRAYFIEPEEAGRKPYALLREALERTGRVAVGKVALRDRERLARITCLDGGLVLETLNWPEELRDMGDLKLPGAIKLSKAEVDMAITLVDNLSRTFDPGEFQDEYRTAVEALVDEKQGKGEVARPEPAEPARVADLMAALKASVEASAKGRGGAARTAASSSSSSSSRGSSRKTTTAARRRKAG